MCGGRRPNAAAPGSDARPGSQGYKTAEVRIGPLDVAAVQQQPHRRFLRLPVDVLEQVDRLIAAAQSLENLAQCYPGWCPFW
eukprot:gene19176-2116_t